MARNVVALVEDDPALQQLFDSLMTRIGWRTLRLSASDNARAVIQRTRPALLIVGVGREYDNTWKLLDQICLSPRLDDTSVIICSADVRFLAEHRDAIRSLGWELLERPFGLNDLLAKVDSAGGRPPARLAAAA